MLLEHFRQGPDLYCAMPSESILDLFFWGPRAGGAHFPAFFGIRSSSSAWHLVMKCKTKPATCPGLASGGQRPRMMAHVYNVQNNPTTKNGLSSLAASTQTEKPCTWHLCQIRGGLWKSPAGKSPQCWHEIAELKWHKMIFPFYCKGKVSNYLTCNRNFERIKKDLFYKTDNNKNVGQATNQLQA